MKIWVQKYSTSYRNTLTPKPESGTSEIRSVTNVAAHLADHSEAAYMSHRLSMCRPTLVIFLLCALGLVSQNESAAQAWTQEPGTAYVKLSYGASTASDQFSFDGSKKPYADNVSENAFFDRSIFLYSAIGVVEGTTVVVSLPYKRLIIRDAAFRYRTFGIGSAVLGIRHDIGRYLGFLGSANALSLNLNAGFPLGYTRNYTPSTGAGQIDIESSAAFGRSFYPAPVYAQASVGYRHRTSWYGLSSAVECQEGVDIFCVADRKPNFNDELTYSAEVGASFANRFLAQLLVNGVWSTRAPVTGFTVTNPLPTRQRYVKVGGGLSARTIDKLSVSSQVFLTPSGRNAVQSIDIFLGLDYNF